MKSQPLLLLSTCGTSVLTNEAKPEDRTWLTAIANEPDLSPSDKGRLDDIVALRKNRLGSSDDAARRRLSSELNGIAAARDRFGPERIQHLLVHTDTVLGRSAAELVTNVIGHNVEPLTASGLRTREAAEFRDALASLTKQLDDRIPGYRQQDWLVVFNLTGGFKSVNAYLQALGMIYADHCVFLFESSTELMEVPRLPVKLAEDDAATKYLTVFRRLSVGYSVTGREIRGAPESLFLEIEDCVASSVWGDVVWARSRKNLLAEALQDPLSAKLTVSERASHDFAKLPPERKVQVNEALDEMAAYLDGKRPQLASRTFQKLKNPRQGSTHELYLWSDGSTGRLFGHFMGGTFVAATISGHL